MDGRTTLVENEISRMIFYFYSRKKETCVLIMKITNYLVTGIWHFRIEQKIDSTLMKNMLKTLHEYRFSIVLHITVYQVLNLEKKKYLSSTDVHPAGLEVAARLHRRRPDFVLFCPSSL